MESADVFVLGFDECDYKRGDVMFGPSGCGVFWPIRSCVSGALVPSDPSSSTLLQIVNVQQKYHVNEALKSKKIV